MDHICTIKVMNKSEGLLLEMNCVKDEIICCMASMLDGAWPSRARPLTKRTYQFLAWVIPSIWKGYRKMGFGSPFYLKARVISWAYSSLLNLLFYAVSFHLLYLCTFQYFAQYMCDSLLGVGLSKQNLAAAALFIYSRLK